MNKLEGFFELTISLLSMMCIYEAINAIGFAKKKRFLIPSLAYAFFVPLSFMLVDHMHKSPYYLIIILSLSGPTEIYLTKHPVCSSMNST